MHSAQIYAFLSVLICYICMDYLFIYLKKQFFSHEHTDAN